MRTWTCRKLDSAGRRRCGPLALGIIAGASLLPLAAAAQMATPMRYNEGPGVKVTDSLVFHPGAAVEMRFDSNAKSDAAETSAPYLRLLAHLDLATTSPQRLTSGSGEVAQRRVQFRLNSALGYGESFSDDQTVKAMRALEVDAGLNLKLLPSRHFHIRLQDNFSRTVSPRNLPTLTVDTIARDYNEAGVGVDIVPGGGRLKFSLGYGLVLDAFEEAAFSDVNKLAHEVNFMGNWLILPQTGIFVQVSQQFYDYYNAKPTTAAAVKSQPTRAYLGLAGLLTPKLGVLAKVGYGYGNYDSGTNFNSPMGHLEFKYRFTPFAAAYLGYEHRFADSNIGNFHADHRVYLRHDQQIGGRFVVYLDGAYTFRTYENTAAVAATASFDSNLITGGVGVDWQAKEWFYLGVGYDIHVQRTDAAVAGGGATGVLDFDRHQVYGKVGLAY